MTTMIMKRQISAIEIEMAMEMAIRTIMVIVNLI